MEVEELHGGDWSHRFFAIASPTGAGCGCIYSCFYLTKMRKHYNLKGSECGDCLKHCFSCFTAGAIYMLINALTGCGCIYSCCYRGEMRAQYNIRGDECVDCLAHVCCELCALTQQYRELKHRGFDMSLGWAGNAERQQNQGGVAMGAPVSQGGMTR